MALIFLCGLSGSGKSTVGQLLAARLGVPFIDTDAEVETLAERSIPRIFAEQGEGAFRLYEERVVDKLIDKAEGVVALGGGTLERLRKFLLVRKLGTLVYLQTEPALLAERLHGVTDRPLLAGAQSVSELQSRLEALLERREARYLAAEVVIAAGSRTVDDILAEVVTELEKPR